MIGALSTGPLAVHSQRVSGLRQAASTVTLPRMNRMLTRVLLMGSLMLILPGPVAGVPATAVPVASSVAAAPDYRWPLAGPPVVTRRFDPPAERWLPGHRGVDLAGSPGSVVYAAGPGTVYFAGAVAGHGVVSIDHPHGLRTTYQPVTALVNAGRTVAAGDPVAVLDPGHDGCPVAACLHWGLRRGESYLDPLMLLGLGQVRLLPVG
jgi:murein DD-endopeptidase MepM/ murein hydrolase activator NlpD